MSTMGRRRLFPLLVLAVFVISSQSLSLGCSMYKITVDGKTMVGCNEDNWRLKPSIWFENAKNKNEYGAAFTGSREVHPNRFAPQSGMNEAGLTFSRLASYFPAVEGQDSGKKAIANEIIYLTEIMHQCRTVEDVARYIEQHDHSIFIDDVFIYIDRSGNYIVVEPYNILKGNDPYYVLSNFCPSITTHEKARKLERYKNGEDFLIRHENKASLAFCTALSDTMHVCRNRNGDGTLLTSIWDTEKGLVNLYFYHSYDTTIQFNLEEELAKGNHIYNVASLFPVNPEFARLSDYKTPFNTPFIRVLLAIVGGALTVLSLVYAVLLIQKRKALGAYKILGVISLLNLLITAHAFVLATNISVFYFDVPYIHYSSTIISASSYIPFLLLLALIPTAFYSYRLIKSLKNNRGTKILLLFNALIYVLMIMGFNYWGLFDVLN